MRPVANPLLRYGQRSCRRRLSPRLYSTANKQPPVQITTLPNRIRVATEDTPGHFSSVGLYVDAGSRYETPETSGSSHFIDRMAFKTTKTRSESEMTNAVDSLGGQILCSSSRESIMYQSSHFHKATPLAMSLIADTVLNPAFLQEELVAQRDAAQYEVREISAKPEQIIPEILHSVAYNNQGLGNSLLCPVDRIYEIDERVLRKSMAEWYRPERMVIAGAGMHHQELVELAEKHFSSLKPSPPSPSPQPSISRPQSPPVPSHLLSPSAPINAKSWTRAASYLFPNQSTKSPLGLNTGTGYTGGNKFVYDPEAEFNHLYIAFESVGIHDDDIYPLATMQVLLGGGGSFSAGGPGKGMYTRLYTHILNHYPQIDHCASFNHIYTDSSLFGLFASFVPASSGQRGGNTPSQILPHLVHQLSMLLYTPIPAEELSRAKNQLKSSLVMALESRSVEVEDLGKQILVHGRKIPTTEMSDKIDAVGPDDIRRVAARIFGMNSGNKPTVVAMGHDDLGAWEETFAKYGVAGP